MILSTVPESNTPSSSSSGLGWQSVVMQIFASSYFETNKLCLQYDLDNYNNIRSCFNIIGNITTLLATVNKV